MEQAALREIRPTAATTGPPRDDSSTSASQPGSPAGLELDSANQIIRLDNAGLLVNPNTGNWLRLSAAGLRLLATIDGSGSGSESRTTDGSGSFTQAQRQSLIERLIRGRFARLGRPETEPAASPGSPRLDNVILNITRRCNLRCSHCAVYVENEQPTSSSARSSRSHVASATRPDGLAEGLAEPDTEQLERLIDSLAHLGAQQLILFGGEPLIRKDIAHLLG